MKMWDDETNWEMLFCDVRLVFNANPFYQIVGMHF
jgi:hypothetical protein